MTTPEFIHKLLSNVMNHSEDEVCFAGRKVFAEEGVDMTFWAGANSENGE